MCFYSFLSLFTFRCKCKCNSAALMATWLRWNLQKATTRA